MSEPVSALAGASFQGSVTVQETGLRGMITLRGDLAGAKLQEAVKKLTGLRVPEICTIALKGDKGVAWMSPDELLLLTPYQLAQGITNTLGDALKGTHHLVANVSDARAVFSLQGAGAREVLAKLAPADLSPAGFVPGEIRRSRLAQVPAAFWISGQDEFEVVCFRSVAQYVFDLLKNAADPNGEIRYF